jgi:hypothetical protein
VDYVSDLLPGVLLFGVGLAATVAPLTNTVLGAVPREHAGVASGTNNAIARIAALVAIAAVGAVVADRYAAAGGPGAPLSGGVGSRASVTAYHWGTGVAGGLVVAGGLISLIGIANPPRRPAAAPEPSVATMEA